MKLLIAGSRSITSFDLSPHIPEGVDLIITGGAKGVDALGEQYARKRGIPTVTVRPAYETYGRAAPIRRDEEMVDMADMVLVVWDGVSFLSLGFRIIKFLDIDAQSRRRNKTLEAQVKQCYICS